MVQKRFLPPEWSHFSLDRFRAKVINHAGEIHLKDGTWHLTLNETYPYQRKIFRLVERLNKKSPLKQNGLLKDKSLSLLYKHRLRGKRQNFDGVTKS